MVNHCSQSEVLKGQADATKQTLVRRNL